MTSIEVIENKISFIQQHLGYLERYKKFSKDEIVAQQDLRGAVERFMFLVVQATIDLAEATISLKHLRKPTSMAEVFEILLEVSLIKPDLCRCLVQMVGFRNILVHGYQKLNYDILYAALQNGDKDVQALVSSVKKAVGL